MKNDDLVHHLAKLASLRLTDKDYKVFKSQFATIIEFINKLKKIDTEDLEPISHVTGLENIKRSDKVNKNIILTNEEALLNTEKSNKGYFEVPLILSGKSL